MSEFDLIESIFRGPQAARLQPDWLVQGIGDDTARIDVPQGISQSLSIDTLVSGIHFHEDDAPRGIGHKSLAVGLSDLAASGARPAWASLSITVPDQRQAWLEQFGQGFFELAKLHNVHLIGGDTSRGPLSVTVQVGGWLPDGKGVTRSGAVVGETIYVTGKLGFAASALAAREAGKQPFSEWLGKLNFPEPRVRAGELLLDVASAMIDVSDGLLADLGHVLSSSGVGAELNVAAIPRAMQRIPGFVPADTLFAALCGGDDYELLFTSSANADEIEELATSSRTKITAIGMIRQDEGLNLDTLGLDDIEIDAVNRAKKKGGYRHF